MDKETYIKYLEILELDSLPQDFPTLAQVKSAYHKLKKLYSFSEVSVVTEPLEDEFSTNDRMEIMDQMDEAYEALVHFLVDKDRVEKEAFAQAGIIEDTKAEYFPPDEELSEEDLIPEDISHSEISGVLDLPEVEDLQADEHELSVTLADDDHHHIEIPSYIPGQEDDTGPPVEQEQQMEPPVEESESAVDAEPPSEPPVEEPESPVEAEPPLESPVEAEPPSEPLVEEPEPPAEAEPREEPPLLEESPPIEPTEEPEPREQKPEQQEEPLPGKEEFQEDDLPEPDEMEIEEISQEIEKAKTDPEDIVIENKDKADTTPKDPYVDTVPFPDSDVDGTTIPLPPDLQLGSEFISQLRGKQNPEPAQKPEANSGAVSAGHKELMEGRSIKGRSLKKVREKLGLGIHEVAVSTKISYKILVNIEKERFAKLPEPGYLRWCISKYAKELTLDHKIVTDEYMRRFRHWQREQESK